MSKKRMLSDGSGKKSEAHRRENSADGEYERERKQRLLAKLYGQFTSKDLDGGPRRKLSPNHQPQR